MKANQGAIVEQKGEEKTWGSQNKGGLWLSLINMKEKTIIY